MNTDSVTLIQERLPLIYFSLLWTVFAFWLAWRGSFWSFPFGIQQTKIVKFSHVIGAFLIFLTSQLIILPISAYLFLSYTNQRWLNLRELSVDVLAQGWINIFGILLGTLLLMTFLMFSEKGIKNEILGSRFYSSLRAKIWDCSVGMLSWMFIFPLVLMIGQLIEIPLSHYFELIPKDQVAVRFIKAALQSTPLFLALGVSVSVVVPIVEELLFRGFVQSWLKKRLGLVGALALTSLIFAFFHFSLSQGISNVELLTSLFTLSLFLGFLKERQQSILASIALHGTFNFISISMIYLGNS